MMKKFLHTSLGVARHAFIDAAALAAALQKAVEEYDTEIKTTPAPTARRLCVAACSVAHFIDPAITYTRTGYAVVCGTALCETYDRGRDAMSTGAWQGGWVDSDFTIQVPQQLVYPDANCVAVVFHDGEVTEICSRVNEQETSRFLRMSQ